MFSLSEKLPVLMFGRTTSTHSGPFGPGAAPVRTENSDSGVLVMKPTDQGMRHDATDPLNRARDRRIFVQ